jgi:hypothetical protein
MKPFIAMVLGTLLACAAFFLVFGEFSKPGDDGDAAAAAWQRRKDEWFYPGRQIEPVAADYLEPNSNQPDFYLIRSHVDPKTGTVPRHYDPKPYIKAVTAADCQPEYGYKGECGKRLEAQGSILYLPMGSLIEVVKNEESITSIMMQIRILRMGKRVTAGAERARIWWMADASVTQTSGLPLYPD